MLSDTRHLKRSAAFFAAGRGLFALTHMGERRSISIENPDVVLSEARATAAHALADYLGDNNSKRGHAAPVLRSILAGLCAMQSAHASTNEWEGLAHKLRNEPALFALLGDARTFAAVHGSEITRLANAALNLRTVSTAQVEWLLDNRTLKQAA
jgi:hypothetical protein